MFSDPWIMGGAGAMIAVIAIAAAFRLYQRIKTRAEKRGGRSSA